MGTVHIIATFTAIAPEDLALFKTTVSEAAQLASSEVGTLDYSYFLNADETRCLMIEKYTDVDALMAHMANVGHLMEPLFRSGGSVDVNILGDAPEVLIEATKDFNPTMYSLFASA